jgi:hypothetical protein
MIQRAVLAPYHKARRLYARLKQVWIGAAKRRAAGRAAPPAGSDPAESRHPPDVFVIDRAPERETIEGAIVTPGRRRHALRQYSGEVYRADLSLCALSTRPSTSAGFKHVPAPPRRVPARLEGHHLYAGPLFGMFGHDLIEFTGRLWPLMTERFDGIVVQKWRHGQDAFQMKVDHTITTILAAFGIGFHDINVIEKPTRVERLTVPEPALHINDFGLPILGDCFRHISNHYRQEPLFFGRGFYLSRTQARTCRVVNEREIEAAAREFGLQVLHPQYCALPLQISLMRQAEVIVGTDGSAMHLAAFARPGTRSLCFETRKFVNQHIIDQVSALDAHYVQVPPDRRAADIHEHLSRILD